MIAHDFEQLLNHHRGLLYKVSRAYAGPAADDLAQEIAIQFWRSLPAFDPSRAKLSTWLYRIALNTAISFQRRERNRQHQPLEELLPAPHSPFSDELQMLYTWIGRLPRPLDKALVLLHLEGQSYREIADILGLSESNVATRLSRLKDTARKELTNAVG